MDESGDTIERNDHYSDSDAVQLAYNVGNDQTEPTSGQIELDTLQLQERDDTLAAECQSLTDENRTLCEENANMTSKLLIEFGQRLASMRVEGGAERDRLVASYEEERKQE